MPDIKQNIRDIKALLPKGVELIAVSKYHPAECITEAYDAGQRIFGESHERELTAKAAALPTDIEWHFIGHLQTNKVRFIAPYISMIDAVDSVRLMREINKQAARNNRTIDILLELHIAAEESKYGFSLDECRRMLEEGEWRDMTNLHIAGIMMMASNVDDKEQIKSEFLTARDFFYEIKNKYFSADDSFQHRSYGMSHDWQIAVECEATMVRIGTAIFGERVY